MDYDDDGLLDFLSGSYDPGDLYLFRGLGDGEYAPVEKLLDETGTPVVHHPEELKKYHAMEQDPKADENEKIQARVASFGSWVTPVDWDADEDLDLLIGSFGGSLYLRENIGIRGEPVYAAESVPVHAAGRPLSVNSHAAPVAADWDHDGLFDLVIGASDGSVVWFRNTGEEGGPQLGPAQELVPAQSSSKFLAQYVEPGELPGPGVRAQICVTDYNGDGLLDLIVGDYSDVYTLQKMSADKRERFDDLVRQERELSEKLWSLTDEAERKAVSTELAVLDQAKERFLADKDSKRRSFVWLYLRKAAATAGTDAPEAR